MKNKKEIRQLLKNLRSGDSNKVSDAGTSIYRHKNIPVKSLISILKKFPNALNREFAAYGLITVLLELESKEFKKARVRKRSVQSYEIAEKNQANIKRILKTLIETVKFDKSAKVRAQALETLGMSSTARERFYKMRDEIEKTVINALSDESAEVRFWACYAAGQLNMKNALPKLRELVETDTKDWGQWWLISEEAEDAIDWIHGRETEARIPFSQKVKLIK